MGTARVGGWLAPFPFLSMQPEQLMWPASSIWPPAMMEQATLHLCSPGTVWLKCGQSRAEFLMPADITLSLKCLSRIFAASEEMLSFDRSMFYKLNTYHSPP